MFDVRSAMSSMGWITLKKPAARNNTTCSLVMPYGYVVWEIRKLNCHTYYWYLPFLERMFGPAFSGFMRNMYDLRET